MTSAVAEARMWFTKRKKLAQKFPNATDAELDEALGESGDPEINLERMISDQVKLRISVCAIIFNLSLLKTGDVSSHFIFFPQVRLP